MLPVSSPTWSAGFFMLPIRTGFWLASLPVGIAARPARFVTKGLVRQQEDDSAGVRVAGANGKHTEDGEREHDEHDRCANTKAAKKATRKGII